MERAVLAQELIIVGDRVLISPKEGDQQTNSGLVLPASVLEKEQIGSGTIVNVGPGYLTANPEYSEGEPWATSRESVRYLPLQARPGDEALFLKKNAVELTFESETYLIVHHADIVALVRSDDPGGEDLLDNIKDLLGGE